MTAEGGGHFPVLPPIQVTEATFDLNFFVLYLSVMSVNIQQLEAASFSDYKDSAFQIW